MSRILLSLLILLSLAGRAWPNTYYVSPAGSNTSPYDTWAKAATAPATVISLNPSGGPHTVYINGIFYNANLSITNANWSGSTIQMVSAAGVSANCSGSACNTYPAGIDEVIISGAYTPAGITWTQVSGTVYYSGNASMTTQPNAAIYTVSGTTTLLTQDSTCSSGSCSPASNHYCWDSTNHGICANVGQIPSTGVLEAAKQAEAIYTTQPITVNNGTFRVANTAAAFVTVAGSTWNNGRFNYANQYGFYAYNFSGSAGTPSITVNGGAANYNSPYYGYYIRTVTYASLSNISATGDSTRASTSIPDRATGLSRAARSTATATGRPGPMEAYILRLIIGSCRMSQPRTTSAAQAYGYSETPTLFQGARPTVMAAAITVWGAGAKVAGYNLVPLHRAIS